MPTLDETMCGVLGGGRQDIGRKLDMKAYRITAFVIPFMAGKHLFLEIKDQGMVVIVR
jgi:hypothetical protein